MPLQKKDPVTLIAAGGSNDLLNVLRTILAFLIVWHHMAPPEIWAGIRLSVPGRVLVWLFYVLSGYLIGRSFYLGKYVLNLRSVVAFYWRRCVRLLPLLYVGSLAVWFLNGRVESFFSPDNVRAMLFLKYYFDFPFVTAAWFIGPLMQLYILAPLLFVILRKLAGNARPIPVVLWLCGFLVALNYASFLFNYLAVPSMRGGVFLALDGRTVLGGLGPFLSGMVLSLMSASDLKAVAFLKNRRALLMWAIAVLAMVGAMYHAYSALFWVLPTVVVVSLAGMLMILWCESFEKEERVLMAGRNKVAAFLLACSPLTYGVFIWHGSIIELLQGKFPAYNSNYMFFLAAFLGVSVAALAVSMVTYHTVERPANYIGNKVGGWLEALNHK